MRANSQVRYIDATGRLTGDGLRFFNELTTTLDGLSAKLAAIAAVASPAGGATTDAEARAAINAIIAGAS
jgi:hypothetical protein